MRRLIGLLAASALVCLPGSAAPANALQSLAYAFVVDCKAPGGTDSLVGLPNGTYVVTIAGGCSIHDNIGFPVGATPCSVPVVGTVPCLSPITTINNFPGEACGWSTGAVEVNVLCPAGTVPALVGCGLLYVAIDGVCLNGQAGLHYRPPSLGGAPMNVRFVDSNYADNDGALLVTVVWTPL